jgi:hypothetical protein
MANTAVQRGFGTVASFVVDLFYSNVGQDLVKFPESTFYGSDETW